MFLPPGGGGGNGLNEEIMARQRQRMFQTGLLLCFLLLMMDFNKPPQTPASTRTTVSRAGSPSSVQVTSSITKQAFNSISEALEASLMLNGSSSLAYNLTYPTNVTGYYKGRWRLLDADERQAVSPLVPVIDASLEEKYIQAFNKVAVQAKALQDAFGKRTGGGATAAAAAGKSVSAFNAQMGITNATVDFTVVPNSTYTVYASLTQGNVVFQLSSSPLEGSMGQISLVRGLVKLIQGAHLTRHDSTYNVQGVYFHKYGAITALASTSSAQVKLVWNKGASEAAAVNADGGGGGGGGPPAGSDGKGGVNEVVDPLIALVDKDKENAAAANGKDDSGGGGGGGGVDGGGRKVMRKPLQMRSRKQRRHGGGGGGGGGGVIRQRKLGSWDGASRLWDEEVAEDEYWEDAVEWDKEGGGDVGGAGERAGGGGSGRPRGVAVPAGSLETLRIEDVQFLLTHDDGTDELVAGWTHNVGAGGGAGGVDAAGIRAGLRAGLGRNSVEELRKGGNGGIGESRAVWRDQIDDGAAGSGAEHDGGVDSVDSGVQADLHLAGGAAEAVTRKTAVPADGADGASKSGTAGAEGGRQVDIEVLYDFSEDDGWRQEEQWQQTGGGGMRKWVEWERNAWSPPDVSAASLPSLTSYFRSGGGSDGDDDGDVGNGRSGDHEEDEGGEGLLPGEMGGILYGGRRYRGGKIGDGRGGDDGFEAGVSGGGSTSSSMERFRSGFGFLGRMLPQLEGRWAAGGEQSPQQLQQQPKSGEGLGDGDGGGGGGGSGVGEDKEEAIAKKQQQPSLGVAAASLGEAFASASAASALATATADAAAKAEAMAVAMSQLHRPAAYAWPVGGRLADTQTSMLIPTRAVNIPERTSSNGRACVFLLSFTVGPAVGGGGGASGDDGNGSKDSASTAVTTSSEPPKWVETLEGDFIGINCDASFHISATAIRIDYEKVYPKAVNYSVMVTLICLAQIVLLFKQLHYSQTQSFAARVSLMCIGQQAIVDALLCIAHLLMCAMMQPVFAAFASIAFFKLIMFCIFEMKYMIFIFQARQPQSFFEGGFVNMRREIASLHGYFYAMLFFVLMTAWFSHGWFTVVVLALYSFWVPQIVSNVKRDITHPLQRSYLVGMSASRLMIPLYVFGCPNAFLHLVFSPYPTNYGWCVILVLWMGLQVAVLISQDRKGARWFIPKRFLPPRYDYQRPIPRSQLRSPTRNRDRTPVAHSGVVREDSNGSGNVSTMDVEQGNSPQCSICFNGVDAGLENYMVTPCDHVFHTECLERWMQIKMECPTCRTQLPPP